jgi:hypothetical protein
MGFRSPLFILGLSSAPAETAAGVRSMLAPWMGGASSTPADTSGGYRSLLAFWMGGASAPAYVPPEPRPPGGTYYDLPARVRDDIRDGLLDEDELLLLLAWMCASGAIH